MASWNELLSEANRLADPIAFLDTKRHELLSNISNKTGRNIITYYSSWLTKQNIANLDIVDGDKNAFMQAIYGMDKKKGLDLILHTPGGDIAAAESIVDYLHSIFGDDIRAIIPQMAMSAGTMIAISCPTIIMGKESSLGPVDPQYHGLSCQEAVDEFDQAVAAVSANPASLGLWQVRVSKYTPTFLVACKNALDWSKSYTKSWLARNYNLDESAAENMSKPFVDHSESKSHSRHFSIDQCKSFGLTILDLESDNCFQDLVLSLHHAYMIFFDKSTAIKAVENQLGARYLRLHNGNPL